MNSECLYDWQLATLCTSSVDMIGKSLSMHLHALYDVYKAISILGVISTLTYNAEEFSSK